MTTEGSRALNRKLAKLLGFTVQKNPHLPGTWRVAHPVYDAMSGMEFVAICRIMPANGPERTARDAWDNAPNFLEDANACLWAWERVINNAPKDKLRYCHINRHPYGEWEAAIVDVREGWRDKPFVSYGGTMLKAMASCMIAVLEALNP